MMEMETGADRPENLDASFINNTSVQEWFKTPTIRGVKEMTTAGSDYHPLKNNEITMDLTTKTTREKPNLTDRKKNLIYCSLVILERSMPRRRFGNGLNYSWRRIVSGGQ